jgi:hypothetical protein
MTAFAHALFSTLPTWRPLRRTELPLWSFLRAARLSRAEALRADRRCGECAWMVRCRRRIARGLSAPPKGCPNADLFP